MDSITTASAPCADRGVIRRSSPLALYGAAVLAILAAVLVYANTLGNEFVYDDGAQILRNYYIRDLHHLRQIFTTNVWSFLGPHAVSNYYRPLMHMVYLIDYLLFGYSPAGYHGTNVLFHAINAGLVVLLGEALGLPLLASLAAGVLFAAHPINTEPVAWVAGIPELTFTCFFLLALILYARARPVARSSAPALSHGAAGERLPRWSLLAASAVAGLFSLFCKETALMLLPAIALYEHAFAASVEPHLRRVRYYAGHIVAVAFYIAMRVYSLGGFQVSTNPYGVLKPAEQFYSTIYLFGKYLGKLVIPWPFSIFYVFYPVRHITDWRLMAAIAGLASCAVAGGLLWRRARPLVFLLVLVFVPLIPVMDMRAIGHNVFTERYLYLPAAAFCLLLAAAVFEFARRYRAEALAGLLALGGAWGVIAHERNTDWHDDVRLYSRTLVVSPDATLIRDNLGRSYLEGFGQPQTALAMFQECIRRMPGRPEYDLDAALALAELRRYDEAAQHLRRSLDLWPNYPEAYLAFGDMYQDQDKLDDAERSYARAVQIKPGYAEAWNAFGMLRRRRNENEEAEKLFRRALEMTDLSDAHLNLGLLFLDQRRYGEAEPELRHVLISDPHSVLALYGLGQTLAATGRSAEAARYLESALNERKFAHPRRVGHNPLPTEAAIEQSLRAMRQGATT